MKKPLSLLLTICMLVSILPVQQALALGTLTPGTAIRMSDATAIVTFTATEAGTYYCVIVDEGARLRWT